ncbi:MAG: Rid family detoxifying hydrolase [Candidatus Goldiibacteriota bacterium]
MAEKISTDKAPAPAGAYSQAVKSGGFVFVSGQLPIDMQTGIINAEGVHKETRIILSNIEEILRAAGSSMDRMVKMTIFLKNVEDIKFVNNVFEETFKGDFPARSVVEVSNLPKSINIEIDAVAEL